MIHTVYMMPTPTQAAKDLTNSIHQIVLKMDKYLPMFGWQIVESPEGADLIAGHAGQTNNMTPVDVAICHGLYPTYRYDHRMFYAANAHVIRNLRQARVITVPSQWVAEIIQREFHVAPQIIGWGIDTGIWQVKPHEGYTLWNKTRTGGVCDPTPIQELARRLPDARFLSTFGDPTKNLKITGRIPFPQMKGIIEAAQVYLATTRETFGIGTLEAMASAVPVLGYRWTTTPELVEHEVHGYLAEPNNYDDLVKGWHYCIEHRERLGKAARERALNYRWDTAIAQFAAVFDRAYDRMHHDGVQVTVVIPCHNYGHFLEEAIDSVIGQETRLRFEIIVVDDASTDNTGDVVELYKAHPVRYLRNDANLGVARTRNRGIQEAQGEFIVCLDADDRLGEPGFLDKLYQGFEGRREIGIVYGRLGQLAADGSRYVMSQWPQAFDLIRQLQGANQVPSCCMFRKSAWEQAGGYRSYLEPSEDANLWTRMIGVGYEARFIEDTHYLYRAHEQSLSAPIRRGEKPAINWRENLTWIQNGSKPIGFTGKPPRWSWPVRDYDQPQISVVIPVGPGHEAQVQRALDSIEAQTYPFWECVVVNDTGGVLSLPPFVREVKIPARSGPSKARNVGVKHSRAPLIAFLDADDYFLPEFLDKTLATMKATRHYVYTDWISINKQGVAEPHTTPDYNPNAVFRQTSIHSINVLIPKSWIEQIGGFDENMRTWEDVDFFMKLAASGLCGERVAMPLVVYDYRSGHLRENGETIKGDLKMLLRQRFQPYIEGRQMCMCKEELAKQAQAKIEQAANVEMVRVYYNGPVAKAPVVGTATGQSYGRRAKGDVFFVLRDDYDAARNLFVPAESVLPL